jgi:hypothetical protein
VTTLRELADHRLEQAKVREMQCGKEDSHFRAITRRFFP